MTLERLALGCLLPSFPGHDAPEWVLRRLEEGLGGLTLFADNIRDDARIAELTRRLRSAGDVLLAVDEEGGDVTRLEAAQGSSFPGNLALGAVDDVELTADVAAALAGRVAAAGLNANLAPVADVNVDPDNPVIGVRSFGAGAELVARHVAAFVHGTQRQGIAACAKHFPGHGATSVDSHAGLPVAGGDLAEALLPFRAAVEAGVRAIMTAHVVVPGFGPEPATLNRQLLSGLLREELGFDGLAITDALEMRAISDRVDVGAAAVAALAAGADALCVGHHLGERAVGEIVAAVTAAVRAGELREERLEDAAVRVAATARWTAPTAAGAPGVEIGAEAARRAVRVFAAPPSGDAPFVVELDPEPNVASGRFEHGLAAVWPGADGVRLGPGAVPPDVPAGRALVVVARDLQRHAWQRELIAVWPEAFVVETGLPGETRVGAATFGAGRANLAALVEAVTAAPVHSFE